MRTAYDLMTSEPKMVASGEKLKTVIQLFLDQGITSSPVLGSNGEILGILTELTLAKAYMLHQAKYHHSDSVGHHADKLAPVAYVSQSLPMIDVLKQIIASPTHRLLVRDDKNRVVGIISPKDLMRAVVGQANPTQALRNKLREAEKMLRESFLRVTSLENRLDAYRSAFNDAPYMAHAVDSEGKIIMSNRREHEFLGYASNELLGKTIVDIYDGSMHEAAREGLLAVAETGHHAIAETALVKKDGTVVYCDIASAAIRDAAGEFRSTISILRPTDKGELLKVLSGIVHDKAGPFADS